MRQGKNPQAGKTPVCQWRSGGPQFTEQLLHPSGVHIHIVLPKQKPQDIYLPEAAKPKAPYSHSGLFSEARRKKEVLACSRKQRHVFK